MWDRESAIGGTGRVTAPAAAFAGTLATRIQLAPPRDPEYKGLVERNNQYLETSFLPGRQFVSPADFNSQLGEWLVRANSLAVRSIQGRPGDLLETEYLSMLPLPPLGAADRTEPPDPSRPLGVSRRGPDRCQGGAPGRGGPGRGIEEGAVARSLGVVGVHVNVALARFP